jgi:hypothetical protein
MALLKDFEDDANLAGEQLKPIKQEAFLAPPSDLRQRAPLGT